MLGNAEFYRRVRMDSWKDLALLHIGQPVKRNREMEYSLKLASKCRGLVWKQGGTAKPTLPMKGFVLA